jgi:hypothetical protein
MVNNLRIMGLKDAHSGDQCVILCPGPSVKEIDLSLIEKHPHVHGVNGAYVLRNRFRYWFCSSPSFYAPNAQRICKIDCSLYFLSSNLAHMIERVGELSRPPKEKTIHLSLKGGKLSEEVSYDLTQTLPWGPTVVLDLVLPTVLWAGYSRILLVGADYPTTNYCHVYSGQEGAPLRVMDRTQDSYSEEMLMAHGRWHIWKKYLELRRPDIQIINCSPQSELTMWERMPLELALKV